MRKGKGKEIVVVMALNWEIEEEEWEEELWAGERRETRVT